MIRLTLIIVVLLVMLVSVSCVPVALADDGNKSKASVTLAVNVVLSPPSTGGGGGGGGPALFSIKTDLFGVEEYYFTKYDGGIHMTIEGTSEDGSLSISIPGGITTALNRHNGRINSLFAVVKENPPSPPEGAHIIGLPYSFGPAGTTFSPPITLVYSYDSATLPNGVAEEDLVISYYDEISGEWVELECVVNTEDNTITAFVSHFTTFAVLGIEVPEPVLEPVTEPVPEPVIPEPIVPEPEPELMPSLPEEPSYWGLWLGISGGILLLGGFGFWLWKRQA